MPFNLDDLRVLVTRPEPQGSELCKAIHQANGQPFYFPTLEILPAPDQQALQTYIENLNQFDWLIFVSPQAVLHMAPKIKSLSYPKIAAIGAGTAKMLTTYHLPVNACPNDAWNSEGLLALPEFTSVEGQTIGIVCAPNGRELLANTLKARGATVHHIIAYQRQRSSVVPPLMDIDVIIVTSNESLHHLKTVLNKKIVNIPLIVISQRMQSYAKKEGFQRIFLAKNASHHAILETLSIVKGQIMSEETVEKKPRRHVLLTMIMVILSVSFVIVIYFSYSYLAELHQAMNAKLEKLQQQTTSLHQSQSTFEQRIERTQEALRMQLQSVEHAQGDAKSTSVMLEVNYLVNLANDQLQFQRNPASAAALLQTADERIRDLHDAKFDELRQALANDIATLRAIPSVDIVGIYARLSAMSHQLNQLPLPTHVTTNDESIPVLENLSWWRKGLHETWMALQKIVVVRYNPAGTLPLITPDQQDFLYQNLQAILEKSMWALLHDQPKIYQDSLQQLAEWIKKYFIQDASATDAILKEIEALQHIDIHPDMPKAITSTVDV